MNVRHHFEASGSRKITCDLVSVIALNGSRGSYIRIKKQSVEQQMNTWIFSALNMKCETLQGKEVRAHSDRA